VNIDRPRIFILILLGTTLSSLFFYPLFSVLHDNIIILQWRLVNTIELYCVYLLFSLLASIAFFLTYKCRNIYLKLLIILVTVFVPFMSFFIYFLEQVVSKGMIIEVGIFINEYRLILSPIIAILVAGILFLFIRYPQRIVKIVLLTLFIISPINLLSIWVGINEYPNDTLILIDNNKNIKQNSGYHKPNNNILVILFDELSYDYLYERGEIKPQYENFRYLSTVSNNYHRALSPGDATLTAISGLIMGKRFENIQMKYDKIYKITKKQNKEILTIDKNNIFAYAKAAGYKTFVFGPYLSYCELFSQWLDGCRSFSVYNYGSLQKEFRFLHPILTTIVIWPRQFPYGLLKNPVFSSWQKNITEQTYELTMKAINGHEPFFIFVHFYLPHLPFVFNKNGYYRNKEPFLQNHENYSRQLDYVDGLLGNLIAELKNKGKFNNSAIVVLADHNYRIMFPDKKRVIPLIIKKRNQNVGKNIYEPVNAEEILRKELFGF